MLNYKAQIAELIKKQLDEIEVEQISYAIEIPPKPEMGDYAFPCFKLARILRRSPQQIAAELAQKINMHPFLKRVQAAGPYVNFFLNYTTLAQDVLSSVYLGGTGFARKPGNDKTIVIDYSSPNIAKPFHIGHLRSTIIGQSLYNIYTYLGYNCVGINHLGDWGTQFGKQILAYKLWGDDTAISQNPIKEFVKLYIRFHDEAEQNPDLNDQARAWFKKLENGDREARDIWKWMGEESLKEFAVLYEKLNVSFDHNTGESFYLDKVPEIVEMLQAKGLLIESDGAYVVELGEDMPPCLIIKADGTTIYTSRDIAAAFYRKRTFNFDKALYLTDYAQNLHFKQWIKVIELMGMDFAQDLIHASFGRVRLTEGPMQTRKGTSILLEELLNEAYKKTLSIIAERNPNLPDREKVAEQVAVGAIIFNDLYNNRMSDIVFNWEEVLNFDGETGPYLQYTYARSCRVLEKCPVDVTDDIDYSILDEPETISLIKSIYHLPEVITRAGAEYEPSVLSRHIMQIARNFNRFYHNNQIICEDDEKLKARLLMCYAANKVIKIGLDLLNMPSPERM